MSPDQAELFKLPPDEPRAREIFFQALQSPIWTENKARLIERYLFYFVLVTKHGTYIDGFAGPQSPDLPDTWSAKLVLESEPKWFRDFFLCETNPRKLEMLERLSADHTDRSVRVIPGDFNHHCDSILADSACGEKVATFCLLDQHTFECHWDTVKKIAGHKSDGNKIELLYFLATGWLDRALHAQRDHEILKAWWGNDNWHVNRGIKSIQRAQLFCERIKGELGYTYAHPWPVFERQTGGRVMYHLIHATDHQAAPKLMSRAYRLAVYPEEPLEQLNLELEEVMNGSAT